LGHEEMPRQSAIPELGSTPQFVPVAEAPPLPAAAEAPARPASAPESESLPLPICRQDESDASSTIELRQRILRDTRHRWGVGPNFRVQDLEEDQSRGTLVILMRGDEHPKRTALRASRARAIERLTNGFTRDELGLEEFEERLDRAYAANAESDLDALVSDLSAETATIVFDAEVVPAANITLVPSTPQPRATAILGSVERRGQLAARASGALAVLGSVVIDLRDVVMPPGVSTLQVSAVLGSIEIIVPPNLAVESAGASILGSFEGVQRVPRDPDPDLPLLRVQGRAVLGSIEIRMDVSESRKQRAALPR